MASYLRASNHLINQNTKNIKGKKIKAIYQYDNGFSDKNREWEKCIIEMESGFLISEETLSPKGTGHTGIWVFSSKEDLKNKIGDGLRKIA